MAKTQLSALAVLLLGSLLPLSESARVVESQLKAELDKTGVDVKSLKTESDMKGNRPKICCCEMYTDVGHGEAECYWQSKNRFDTGSGCNVMGMFNPWASRQHISGITDQTAWLDTAKAEDPAKNLLVFNPNVAAMQEKYGQLCEALGGADADDNADHGLIRLKDVHGHTHQYLVDIGHFAASEVVVHEPPPPVETPATEEDKEADKKVMEVVVAKIQLKVTNKTLKKATAGKNPDLCSLACDMWPEKPMGNNGRRATAKKGCHSPLSQKPGTMGGFNHNGVKYCKKVCAPENRCK